MEFVYKQSNFDFNFRWITLFLWWIAIFSMLFVWTMAFDFLSWACPPHLHLTSKVMVIVWRLRGNIIRTVIYIANVLPLQWAQLTKTVYTARLGLEFVFFCVFKFAWFICIFCMFVTLDSWVISFFCFGAGLNESPSSFCSLPLLRVRSWLYLILGPL